jgi:hypothetical protein
MFSVHQLQKAAGAVEIVSIAFDAASIFCWHAAQAARLGQKNEAWLESHCVVIARI